MSVFITRRGGTGGNGVAFGVISDSRGMGQLPDPFTVSGLGFTPKEICAYANPLTSDHYNELQGFRWKESSGAVAWYRTSGTQEIDDGVTITPTSDGFTVTFKNSQSGSVGNVALPGSLHIIAFKKEVDDTIVLAE